MFNDPELKQIFPKTSDSLIEILESMLSFNPYFRPTAKDLLKHPIFDERNEEEKLTKNDSQI